MDQNFQTSFIPKKPIIEERVASSQPISIFLIASLFILFIVLLGTGGLYFYKVSINKNLATLQASLTLAQNNFEPSEITQLQVLDNRLRASTEILSNHFAITPLFAALEQITMHTVRFTKFNYDLGADQTANIDVKMSGVAIGYRSVALQSDLFNQNKNFINPVFSNLTLDNSGNVLFDLEFSVPPSFLNYEQSLLTSAPTPASASVPTVTPTAPTIPVTPTAPTPTPTPTPTTPTPASTTNPVVTSTPNQTTN